MRVIMREIRAPVNLVFEVDLCEFLGKCLWPSGLWGARMFIARITGTTSPLGAPVLSTRSVNNGLITHLNAALVYRAYVISVNSRTTLSLDGLSQASGWLSHPLKPAASLSLDL